MPQVSQNSQEGAGVSRSSRGDYHFTYRKSDNGDLQQGDVLEKTDQLAEVLRAANPYCTSKEDYGHFVILTQSCDLVRRDNGKCGAKCINLAAVRPLEIVIKKETAKLSRVEWQIAGVCSDEHKDRITGFVKSVLNNNVSEYFYFEPEPRLRLNEPCCAFLRLSIAVRAHEHYETLKAARIFSLTEGFRAKLGWLVGNIYSRIGTQDWVPEPLTKEEFNEKTTEILDGVIQWKPERKLDQAKKTVAGVPPDKESLLAHINAIDVPSKKERVVEAVLGFLEKNGIIQAKDKRTVGNQLTSHQGFSNLFK